MDIVISLIGVFFLLPLLILFSIFIKVVSPGPVLFKQNRVGYGEKLFSIFKFRTMKHNADISEHRKYLSELIKSDENDKDCRKPMTKLTNDSQIIPFGKILRLSGIDELPQLFNVLLGDMSLIGPRPAIPYEVEEYNYWYFDRFDTLPGITGLWQVSGKNRLTFKEMIRLDVRYVRNLSFWMDLKILLLTPRTIFIQIKDGLINRSHKKGGD
jgi:lipopolysaccharide/colanic/teichoic acid biosynthesis glycosyltransferase